MTVVQHQAQFNGAKGPLRSTWLDASEDLRNMGGGFVKGGAVVPVYDYGIIEVGTPATVSIGSDSYPATVAHVGKDAKTLLLRADTAVPTAKHQGPYGIQDYTYEPDPNGREYKVSLRQDGRYRVVGETGRGCYVINIGSRRQYTDPSY